MPFSKGSRVLGRKTRRSCRLILIAMTLAYSHSGWAGERPLSLIRPAALPPQPAVSTLLLPVGDGGGTRSLIHRPPIVQTQELRPAAPRRTTPHQPHRLILQPPILPLPDPPSLTGPSKPLSRKLIDTMASHKRALLTPIHPFQPFKEEMGGRVAMLSPRGSPRKARQDKKLGR